MFMGMVGFTRRRDDGTDEPSVLQISESLWRDMGAPTHITLTVVPGDKLNGR